ncbi:hypothetical protein ACLB2K_044859 [Fragaria x ananassa]
MAESSIRTRRRRRNLRNRPREAKKQTLSKSESSNKTLHGGRNWIDLPDDVTASILSRLSMFDILERAQRVCLPWRRICMDPLTWRTIRMEFDIHLRQQKINGNFTSARRRKHLRKFHNFNAHKMCHHAVHLSFGNLVDIRIRNCGTDELLQLTDRRLSIVFSAYITMEGVGKVASKIPLLEDLEISYTPKSCNPFEDYTAHESLEAIGRSCPLLKSLRWNKQEGDRFEPNDNRDAFAIAGTMHRLQNLQLFGNWLDHEGLHAILEGCPSLESLDLRQCIHLRPSKQYGWRVRCEEQIKNLRLPVDPIDDYEHIVIHRIVNRKYWEYMKDMMI